MTRWSAAGIGWCGSILSGCDILNEIEDKGGAIDTAEYVDEDPTQSTSPWTIRKVDVTSCGGRGRGWRCATG